MEHEFVPVEGDRETAATDNILDSHQTIGRLYLEGSSISSRLVQYTLSCCASWRPRNLKKKTISLLSICAYQVTLLSRSLMKHHVFNLTSILEKAGDDKNSRFH